MEVLRGRPGTLSGLLLRIGQCLFASASIGMMVSAFGFSNYTAFCYLIASMGLQVLWSFGLACLDAYALKIKKDLHSPALVSLFIVGDWILPIPQYVDKIHLADKTKKKSSHMLLHLIIVSIRSKHNLVIMVTATLSLAAACSSAGIIVLYTRDMGFCKLLPHHPCIRFQISIALAFVTWFLIFISSLVMFWLLGSL